MALRGLVTTIGMQKCQEADSNVGWLIHPLTFGVSETAGTFSASRTTANTMWYSSTISSRTIRDVNTIEFRCTIPAGSLVVGSTKAVAEIYIFAQVSATGETFLLALGQPDLPPIYDPDGALAFRLQIRITGTSTPVAELFRFEYTQATEISDHDVDPNAHPEIQTALQKAGVAVQPGDFEYYGQFWDEKATLDASVTDKMIVYRDTNGTYKPALATGGSVGKPLGIADKTRTYWTGKYMVICFGLVQTNFIYAVGTKLYLSDTTPGAITDTVTAIEIAQSLGNGLLMIKQPYNQVANLIIQDEVLAKSYRLKVRNGNIELVEV